MKLQAGERIAHFTIINKLGQGGMSEVYLAQDDENQRQVVLKFPHEDMMGDPATFERFNREIKIGGLLDHPNIQKLYEVGGGKAVPYLVLEYVEGCTLREFLHQHPHLPLEKAVSITVQIAQALSYAHKNQVLHRDLKPENIIITNEDQAKVMDFGIAFIEGARRVTWGRLSSQVGTPDYMAPEQIKGKRGDIRTDIYALGIMAYEMLAGRPPFQGDNALAIMNQHVTSNPPPLHKFNKKVPIALEEVVLKAIRRDLQLRWQTMEDFAKALSNYEKIDTRVLQAEREKEQAQATRPTVRASADNPLGLPLWQVALIIIAILLAIIAFGVIAQLLHR